MVVAEDRVGALALQLVDGLERLLAVAGAGIGPGRDERRGEVGGTAAPALREMRPGGRVLLRLEVLRPERQMRKPVGVVAPHDPVGEPEGVRHRAVGEERDEGPLQHLRIARVGLEGLAVVARRGRGVAQRAGDIGRKIVALEAVGRLEARRRRRPRREAPRGGGRRGRDAGRGDEQNRDELGEKARVRQRHEVRLQGGRAGARFEPHRQIGAHNGLCRAAPQGETMALCTAASAGQILTRKAREGDRRRRWRGGARRRSENPDHRSALRRAPSTTLRMVPLTRFAGEDQGSPAAAMVSRTLCRLSSLNTSAAGTRSTRIPCAASQASRRKSRPARLGFLARRRRSRPRGGARDSRSRARKARSDAGAGSASPRPVRRARPARAEPQAMSWRAAARVRA